MAKKKEWNDGFNSKLMAKTIGILMFATLFVGAFIGFLIVHGLSVAVWLFLIADGLYLWFVVAINLIVYGRPFKPKTVEYRTDQATGTHSPWESD